MKKVLCLIMLLSAQLLFAAPHSVTLSWTASASSGVTGYNVYRGTVAGGENYAVPVNSALISGLTFTDNSVVATQTYFYTVKAFCPTCSPSSSLPSNEVSGTVPSDPQPAPPTGVTLTAN